MIVNARCLQTAIFLDDKRSTAQTSRQIAAVIRRAYRQDLRSTASTAHGTLCFPHHPTTAAGAALKYVFSNVGATSGASAAAIVPHLTLCEALACPAPFPTLAISHYLESTSGHLDLSPPRVATHSRPLLHRLCTSLAPLISPVEQNPVITALSVPAAALRGTGQLPLLPIASILSHVTCLSITPEPRQVTVQSPANASQANLSSSALHSLLQHMSPATLRHISAPIPLSPCPAADHVFETLATFTGLTSLTLGLPAHPVRAHFTAMASLPSLRRLHLTHAPRAVLALGPIRLAPTLTRLHVIGNGPATRHILASSALSFNAPLPQTLIDIAAEPCAELPGCAVTAAENRTIKNKFDTLVQTPRRSLLLPLGTTHPDDLPSSTLTTLRRLALSVTDTHAIRGHLQSLPHLRSLIVYLPSLVNQLQVPEFELADLPPLRHLRVVCAQSLSLHPCELRGVRDLAAALLRSLSTLHTFEVVHLGDVSEAQAPACTVPQCMDSFAEVNPRLEALDDEEWGLDAETDAPDRLSTADPVGRVNPNIPCGSPGTHTVRVSRCLLAGGLAVRPPASCLLRDLPPDTVEMTKPSQQHGPSPHVELQHVEPILQVRPKEHALSPACAPVLGRDSGIVGVPLNKIR